MKKEMRLSKNYVLNDFIYSRMAIENGLDNTPKGREVEAIKNLVEKLLQPLCDFCGFPIYITSGDRSIEVNRLVGGVESSQHVKGEAVDCYTGGGKGLLYNLGKSELPFDQAILYSRKNMLHLSLSLTGDNRKQVIIK